MLSELQIINFAIIDKLNMSFENGLTVFTGETGAGKSIIIDAIALLAGGRGSSDYVRHGAQKAEIEALFDTEDQGGIRESLNDLGVDQSDGQLILKREISSTGKSICRVNGKLVTLSVLQQFGRLLVDIHGQHEHQQLLEQGNHLSFVDRFGGNSLKKLKQEYRNAYKEVAKLAAQCNKYNQDEKQLAQRIDLLQYQIGEIDAAHLKADEEERLLEEKRKLVNFEKVFQMLKASYEALGGDNASLDLLRQATGYLDSIRDLDPELAHFSESVANCFYLLEEQTSAVRAYLEQMEYNPERLDEIELRLNEIHLLKKKYGNSVEEIMTYNDQIKKEYEELNSRDQNFDALNEALQTGLGNLRMIGVGLSSERKKTSVQLARAINAEFKDLCMEHAMIDIHVKMNSNLESFSGFESDGIDQVSFYITTNPGEPFKPLAKIASGGELSRIMLAIKTVFKKVIGPATIIFDEVDTGVSGRAAQAMAEKISKLSKNAQVFCITHLPQVAAMADQHVFIEKYLTKDRRTGTLVKKLNESDKIREIGRMISGPQMTELAREHARELIEMAEKTKQ
ncbi:DNA repair protein RecN [Sporolactobacillus laevolacticus]|uniref:DNA repair protein RecN n=1 Tax=Sporolactobacillus laevolacticus DSM 442 TaxID=1395513 RepID=V6J2S9_9BACL|nr:DNA repair protein RecN [Sporolactobacillus laevolacticus]EST11074.1 DNA repair protein RecN [Sporolactobacillus laevolacticus DSM 442]